MKKHMKPLTVFVTMLLFLSSCDLLYDPESEVMNYVTVPINMVVCVAYDNDTSTPPPQPVQIKIFKEGINISKKLTTDASWGCAEHSTGTYRMREGEVFTASAYLINYPNVYKAVTLDYQVALQNGVEPEDGPKSYAWNPAIQLIVPK